MLLKYLEELKNNTNEEEFRNVLLMVQEDIKFNKVSFNKITTVEEFIEIVNICLEVYRRC